MSPAMKQETSFRDLGSTFMCLFVKSAFDHV